MGRMRPGPEKALTEKYLGRFDKAGRAIGLGPSEVVELAPGKRGRKNTRVNPALSGASRRLCALDECGAEKSSAEFSRMLARWRDDGVGTTDFLIGGPDGLAGEVDAVPDAVLSLGRMVFPHMLVRAMLAEQLYRSVSILSGTPYHRG